MMIRGLHHLLEEKIAKRAAGEARLTDPDISPNERHSLEWTAGEVDRDVVKLTDAIAEGEMLVRALQTPHDLLTASPHKSRLRSLAITDLEQAQDRIRRELGDKPAN